MYYFDCLCEIGPRNDKDPAAPWSVDDVLRWMDHCGIAGALVTHTLSITDDPIHARQRLAAEIARAADRLFPVWAVLPPQAGDFERSPDDLIKVLADHDVRAVKLFPESHAWPLDEAVIGPTLEALERRRILTLLDIQEVAPHPGVAFEKLDRLLSAHPDLPLLLQRQNWGVQRAVVALMERHSNLHIELSSYQAWRVVEQYVERFGPDRLLFGTGLPAMSAGAARAFVDYARIPAEAKRKIAGENLSRLLGGLRPRSSVAVEPDPLRDRAARGLPLAESPVLDAHCHLLCEGRHSAGRTVIIGGDAEGLVALDDIMGVRKTAIMPWSGPVASDPIKGNDVVARAVARYPDRFIGVAYVNPSHLSPDRLMREVRLRVEEQGFRGLKPYHRVDLRYDHPLYEPCWEYANERRLYALLHLMTAVTGGPEVVDKLAERYPDVQWLVAHVGGRWKLAREVATLVKKRKNVWAEITYTAVLNNIIEWMVSEVGDDRILFGTDAPMRDPRPQLGWVAWADLPLESREKILGRNFLRVLRAGEERDAPGR